MILAPLQSVLWVTPMLLCMLRSKNGIFTSQEMPMEKMDAVIERNLRKSTDWQH